MKVQVEEPDYKVGRADVQTDQSLSSNSSASSTKAAKLQGRESNNAEDGVWAQFCLPVDNSITGNTNENDRTSWWGQKYGFVAGGFLGTRSSKTKSTMSKNSQRNAFAEDDQENLYNLVQDKATTGKQGIGIKNHPKKVAGHCWEGKKVSFDDSDGECSADSSASLKRKRLDCSEAEDSIEPKIKLKRLCIRLLHQAPCHSLRLKELKELVDNLSSFLADFSSKRDAMSFLKDKLEGSRKFCVSGKRARLSS